MAGTLRAVSVLLIVVLAAAGCGRVQRESPSDARSITDDLGRSLRLDGVPQRIVSLAPSFTETLYALGADSLLVGVTRYCNYPPAAKSKTNIGDLLAPDIEGILALDPDVVLISIEGNSQHTFARLQEFGVRVFVSNPRDLDGVLKSITDIAEITGRTNTGKKLTSTLRAVRDSVLAHPPVNKPAVLMLLSLQPLIAAGSGTFIGELIESAGGRNAAGDLTASYPVMDREDVLLRNPDILLLSDDLSADPEAVLERFPEWKRLTAFRREAMHRIEADKLMRPGPRLFDILREFHEMFLHTESDHR
ncbi:MAG: cobalamin-binding protein [Bacteroidia bacterium]|nr:cobalamin-binding protein [Bacteroidia bacterium]